MRACLVAIAVTIGCGRSNAMTKEKLGGQLFADTQLSEPAGQACADCHVARVAFADPEDDRTSAGVIRDRFGVRNTQALFYARFVPPLHREGERMIGGLFWDGRANSLEEQIAGPLLNPLEMNNASKSAVVAKIRAKYGSAFREVFGSGALDDDDRAFAHMGEAIAAFERTAKLAPFASKYDRYVAGKALLDTAEERGLAIFQAHCATCHQPPLFTDYSYANLGVPRFADNPFYLLPQPLNPDGEQFIDHGLAKTTGDPAHDGMFRVPSLRNVARTTPYGHNGYFRRLDEMIAFHASTTLAPEVPGTVDRSKLASFAPTKQDIAELVAFLRTLTDTGVEGAHVVASP